MYSTVRKDTSFNNIGTQGSAGKLATAKTLLLAATPATAGMKATAETPTKPGTPAKAEMPATVGTQSKAGMQATAMTQATTVTLTAAEMPETVPAKVRDQYKRRVKIDSFCRMDFSQTDSFRTIGNPIVSSPIVEVR